MFDTPSNIGGPLEGSRFYKIDGNYYIFTTQYANGEYVLRSTNGPFGPYELKPFAVKLPYAGKGARRLPAPRRNRPDRRTATGTTWGSTTRIPRVVIPVMAPVTWTDGWPSVDLVNGQWGASYPFPDLPCGAGKVKSHLGKDTFSQSTLGPEWEWNHNPDNTKVVRGHGLTLQTATVTDDFTRRATR